METSHNTMKLAQLKGKESQHNKISTIKRKKPATQRKQVETQ